MLVINIILKVRSSPFYFSFIKPLTVPQIHLYTIPKILSCLLFYEGSTLTKVQSTPEGSLQRPWFTRHLTVSLFFFQRFF